jgi:hypothetical protein
MLSIPRCLLEGMSGTRKKEGGATAIGVYDLTKRVRPEAGVRGSGQRPAKARHVPRLRWLEHSVSAMHLPDASKRWQHNVIEIAAFFRNWRFRNPFISPPYV